MKKQPPSTAGPRGSVRLLPSTPTLNRENAEKLYIGTLNVRSLVGIGRLDELEHALKNIKWHILGLSEVKKEGTYIQEYRDYVFMYTGKKSGKNGVGFMIKKRNNTSILNLILSRHTHPQKKLRKKT
jgi:exonuclease III